MSHSIQRDPLPESFATLEEFWQFWDTHSSADYEDQMKDVEVEVDLKASKAYCRIERRLLQELRTRAQNEGLSTEDLIERWLREKLAAA